MKMKTFLIIAFFFTQKIYAANLNPLCNGVCPECRFWMPILKTIAADLKGDYLSAESELSSRYNSEIHPLLEERIRLLKTYDVLTAELETLNKLIVIKTKEINRQRKNQ